MSIFDIFLRSSKIENVCISRDLPNLRKWKIDTLFITTSVHCDLCTKYNRKVYSLYGWNKKYPILPNFLKQNNCPMCHRSIGATIYFDETSSKPKYNVIQTAPTADCFTINGKIIDMYTLYCKYPNDKISAIKELRKITGCSLSDGKKHIDNFYRTIKC